MLGKIHKDGEGELGETFMQFLDSCMVFEDRDLWNIISHANEERNRSKKDDVSPFLIQASKHLLYRMQPEMT